jgi:hypothetical protein
MGNVLFAGRWTEFLRIPLRVAGWGFGEVGLGFDPL